MNTTALAATRSTARLPLSGLLALAMTGFICILTETLPAGLLPQIGTGLGVSDALAGQLVTLYALGSLIAAIPLTIATRRWPRRRVLLLAIVGFLMFNTITALSGSYALTLAARLLAGVAAGLAWSLVAGYARRMVAPHQQGRALAIAMVGTPIALSLGVPAGTWLGTLVGWRNSFGLMSLATAGLVVWVLTAVPDFPGQSSRQRTRLAGVFTTPGVRPVLAVVVAWMLAHNLLYTYVAPLAARAGLSDRVDLVLLTFGTAALCGIWFTGRHIDTHLRHLVLGSLLLFAATASLLGAAGDAPALVFVLAAAWGASFGGAATQLQTALADSAGDGADVALSMNVTVWNSAIAGGGLLGGVILQHWGVAPLPWVAAGLVVVALATAWQARRHGFSAGRRRNDAIVVGH